jgi:hypothetical protein
MPVATFVALPNLKSCRSVLICTNVGSRDPQIAPTWTQAESQRRLDTPECTRDTFASTSYFSQRRLAETFRYSQWHDRGALVGLVLTLGFVQLKALAVISANSNLQPLDSRDRPRTILISRPVHGIPSFFCICSRETPLVSG